MHRTLIVVAFLSYISAYNLVVSVFLIVKSGHSSSIVASKLGCVSILIATTKPRRLVAKNRYALYTIPQNTERVLCHSFLVTTTVEENEQSRSYKKSF